MISVEELINVLVIGTLYNFEDGSPSLLNIIFKAIWYFQIGNFKIVFAQKYEAMPGQDFEL